MRGEEMADKSTVRASDIKIALAKKHKTEFFITECKTGPTVTGLLQFDAIAIYKSWSHPRIVGYEVKVSRGDFLRDSKYSLYLPYCHEFYFVTQNGLIDRAELANDIGLIYYNPETQALVTKKRAVHRKVEISGNMLMYIIMNRLDSDRIPFVSDKAEYWRMWLNGKMNNRELGYQVSGKLISEIDRLENELQRYSTAKNKLEELEKIFEVMKKHGINAWYNPAKNLDEALSREYPRELDTVHNQLLAAIKEIEKLKGKKNEAV